MCPRNLSSSTSLHPLSVCRKNFPTHPYTMSVLLETTEGDLVIDLFTQEKEACLNFLKLCKLKYYHFSPFYNVNRDFAVETGDSLYPIGRGGECADCLVSKSKSPQFTTVPNSKTPPGKGVVSFVSQKVGSSSKIGSRLLITLTDDPVMMKDVEKTSLAFGRIVEGEDTLAKINTAICDKEKRPLKDIRILHTFVLDEYFPELADIEEPGSPEPSSDQLSTVRLMGQDEDEDEEAAKERESKSHALTLEILGDLPSADAKPRENVLFICKLNPLTQEEDLSIIFARFGKVVSCEIVKDKETGNSLQYGFIEFDSKRSCELAYSKMDDVLIDDRRIHVDFCQSVKRRKLDFL